MKHAFIALCTLFLVCSCSDKKPEGNLHLTGYIKGLKTGTIYIQKIVDTTLVSVDTIVINGDSHFESWLTIKSPEMYYLSLDRGRTNSIDNNLPFFAEPGVINIDTDLEHYYYNAKITGSKNQKLYEDYKKVTSRFTDQNLTITADKFRAQKSNNASKLDSLEKVQKGILQRKYLFATNFAINNKDHEIAPYIALTEIYDINLKYLDTIQKSMTPKVAKSFYGEKLTTYYNKRKNSEK